MTWRGIFRNGARPDVLAVYEGCPRQSKKLCFFAAYDAKSRVSPFLLRYIEELRRCDFDVVICLTSPRVGASDVQVLARNCHKVILRGNAGHDFYSWKICFAQVGNWRNAEAVLLTNDSILGPLSPLAPLVERAELSSASVVGLNDSYERGYHLQSFFLYIKPEVLKHWRFRCFWRKLSVLDNKNKIVKRYEVGLSKQLLKWGFELSALFPATAVLSYCKSLGDEFQYPEVLRQQSVNVTLYCWYELVTQFAYPFIKADVVRVDRYQSKHYHLLTAMLATAIPSVYRDELDSLVASSKK